MSEVQRTLGSKLQRAASWLVLSIFYGGAIILADFIALLARRTAPRRNGVLILTSTFFNPNWYLAHVAPLSNCGLQRVLVVADGHIGEIPGIEVIVPPRCLSRILTRAGAKFVLLLWLAIRLRPAMVMGYHIFPAAMFALVAGKLSGAQAAYQVTSGQLELEGGGWHAENRLLTSLGWPSQSVERLALALTKRFDLIVVRGTGARSFITERSACDTQPVIITGSVARATSVLGYDERDNDIVFVGRLAEYKRPDRFLRAFVKIAEAKPGVRALIVGDGPDRADIEREIAERELGKSVQLLGLREDIPAILSRSKVLIQTSRWEGVSIAVLEAMMHGVVPVVSDVGDLRDVVVPGETGFLVSPDDVASYARYALELISDPTYWSRLSRASHERALASYSVEAVSTSWRRALAGIGAEQRTTASQATRTRC